MPWKMDGDHVALDGSKLPIWVNDDGTEAGGIDFARTQKRLTEVNEEAKSHRLRAEAAEGKLKPFEGLDPEKVKKDAELLANLDAKKLLDAGEAAKLREQAVEEISRRFAEDLKAKDAALTELQEKYSRHRNRAALSDALKAKNGDKPVFRDMSVDAAERLFGAYFAEDEKGNLVAYYDTEHKQPVLSRKADRMHEPADPVEALPLIVGKMADKDFYFAGVGATGSGVNNGGGVGGNGKTMARSQFEQLQPADQMKFSKDGGTLTDG